MNLDINSLTKNPIMLCSALLFAAAIGLLLTSIILLTGAIFYSPTASIYNIERSSSVSGVNTGDISGRNFFGVPAAEPDISEIALPETDLALVLRGAFAQTNADDAGAIIEDENTKIANHYVVGEEVTQDATLKAVYKDRIVLARNGIFETLYFPDMASQDGLNETKARIPGSTGGATLNLSTDEAKKRREAIRERIKQLRKR